MATDGTIACKLCGDQIPVTFHRANNGPTGHLELTVDSAKPLVQHMNTCRGSEAASLNGSALSAELVGRIHRMLDMRAYVATGGSRACTMCGVKGADCVEMLSKPGKRDACCPACGAGNTHPAPGEVFDCQVWAAEHGPKD